MKKTVLVLIIALLVACKGQNIGFQEEKNNYMKWEDAYFEKIFSQVFKKDGNQITYSDILTVEKISWDYIDENEYLSVSLTEYPYSVDIRKPELEMKSIADLQYFKNLKYFETSSTNFEGIEILSQVEQLKTLVLPNVDLNENLIQGIAQCGAVETLTIPFVAADYSACQRKAVCWT